ncbi:hypothetical protein FKM82_024400 [Ascaphus truei]
MSRPLAHSIPRKDSPIKGKVNPPHPTCLGIGSRPQSHPPLPSHPGSRETYNALTNWLTDARTLASPNIVIILCGNKKDLDADREVTFLEASRFAQENELMFLETSALTGENVEEAFLKCARNILNKIESGKRIYKL